MVLVAKTTQKTKKNKKFSFKFHLPKISDGGAAQGS